MKIRKYDAIPTLGFTEKIIKGAGTGQNAEWLAECIDAHTRLHNAIQYMTESVKDHESYSADILMYILLGMDFDTFESAMKAESQPITEFLSIDKDYNRGEQKS